MSSPHALEQYQFAEGFQMLDIGVKLRRAVCLALQILSGELHYDI